MFSANRKLGMQLYRKNADGSGSEQQVVDLGLGLMVNPWDWSQDGKYALFRKGNELWYFSWPESAAKPLLQAKWTVQNAQFSPDGRWMAYASNETGNMEIYVWLASCYFAHDSSGFRVLLPFCDAQSARSHPPTITYYI